MEGGKDQEVLAEVLTADPDAFVTGDADFDTPEVKGEVELLGTRDLLEGLEQGKGTG